MPRTISAVACSWSEPSALVGVRYMAQAVGSAVRVDSTGSWYPSDLPEEVPVAITTSVPAHASSAQAAWWEKGR